MDEETGELVLPKTLGYGQLPTTPGLHIMQTSSTHYVEMLTGVGGTGVGLVLAYAARPLQGHAMIPTAQFGMARGSNSWSGEGIPDTALAAGVDLMLPKAEADGGAEADAAAAQSLMDLVLSVASGMFSVLSVLRMRSNCLSARDERAGDLQPQTMVDGNTDFQLSRGFTGISL